MGLGRMASLLPMQAWLVADAVFSGLQRLLRHRCFWNPMRKPFPASGLIPEQHNIVSIDRLRADQIPPKIAPFELLPGFECATSEPITEPVRNAGTHLSSRHKHVQIGASKALASHSPVDGLLAY